MPNILQKFRRRPWPDSIEQLKHLRISYSQFAEDLILTNILGYEKTDGFYVDVGCFEPIQFSNTFIFYQRGWRGLAIDANPALAPLWKKRRPRDTFINLGIAEQPSELEYFQYPQYPACNGFGVKKRPNLKCVTTRIRCEPLAQILSDHLPPNQQIDLMSVDCEGMDLQALRSSDFNRFRPRVLLIEDDDKSHASELQRYCESLGYKLHSLCHRSKIFTAS